MAGRGRVRRKATKGRSVVKSESGNGALDKSEPGGGVEPDDPSATSLVYICVSFFAPVSTRRAYERKSVFR